MERCRGYGGSNAGPPSWESSAIPLGHTKRAPYCNLLLAHELDSLRSLFVVCYLFMPCRTGDGEYVFPVCLPCAAGAESLLTPGTNLLVAGWGAVDGEAYFSSESFPDLVIFLSLFPFFWSSSP